MTASYYGLKPCIPSTPCPSCCPSQVTNSIPAAAKTAAVQLANGVLNFTHGLLASAGLGGGGIDLTLNYIACLLSDGSVGTHCTFNYNSKMTENSPVTLVTGEYTTEEFVDDGAGGYSSVGNNTSAVLTRTGEGTPADQFTLISRDGNVSVFYGLHSSIATPGRLKSITDRFGNTQIHNWVSMAGNVRLVSVTDSYGREINFTYDPAQDYRMTQVVDFDGRQVTFQYDSAGRLVAVVGPAITRGANNNANIFTNGTATVFQYDVDNARSERQNDLIAVYDPNQVAPYLGSDRTVDVAAVYAHAMARRTISYYNDPTDDFHYGKVQQVTESTSSSAAVGSGAWGFIYINSGLPANLIDPSDPIVSRTIVTDRNGNQTTYDFNANQMLVRKEAFATRGKNSLEAASWVTWTKYNSHNQPLLIVMPEGNSVAYEYEDETNTITFGGVPYGRRIGLIKSVTRLPGNTLGIPSRAGSGPNGAVQNQLITRQFNEPLFAQACASIEERGNPIDPTTGLYFPPQNLGTTPTDGDRSRYATINYFDYQKDTTITVQGDASLQSRLGLTSAQIGQLISFVNGQMTATDGMGGIPAGFEMGIGDVNGEGTGSGTTVAARHQGAVVKVKHPAVRQLIPNIVGTYPKLVLEDGPVAYWRLNEITGTASHDSSGNANNGTYTGTYTLGQLGAVALDPDTAVDFDAAGYSHVPFAPSLDLAGNLTIEAWAKWSSTTGGDEWILEKARGDDTQAQYYLWWSSTSFGGNALVFGWWNLATSSYSDHVFTFAPTIDQWYHITATADGKTVRLYINGSLVASMAQMGVMTASGGGTLNVAAQRTGYAPFSGTLDEVALYNNSLPADQVLNHYAAGISSDPWLWAEQQRMQLFTSNSRGQQTTAADPEGNLTVYVRYPENDPEGAGQFLVPTLSNQQYGFMKEVHVDADPNRVMSLIGSDGDMIAFVGNKISRTNTPGVYQDLVTKYQSSSTSAGCTSCAYDPLGNPLSMTDPRGFTTTYSRNELGEVYRTTTDAPYNYQTETSFDANRNVIQAYTSDVVVQYESNDATDPNYAKFIPTGSGSIANLPVTAGPGGSVRPGWFSNLFTFDLLDNKIEDDIDATGSVPSSLVTTYAYDFNQNLITITKPEGNLVEHDYDERDLRIAARIGYDPSISQPGAVTVMAYDGNGNLIDAIGPIQRGTSSQALTVVIDDAFRSGSALTHVGDWVAANTYDGFDRMIQSTDAVGGIATNTFDPGGRTISSQTNGTAGGSTPIDRTGSLNVPLSSGATNFDEGGRAYEQLQNVFINTGISGGSPTHVLPSGRTVTHTGGGLATNSTTDSNTAAATLTTGGTSYVLFRTVYDRATRSINSASDNGAFTSYAYDGANRQISMTDALGNQMQNTYDGNGNVVTSTRAEKCTIPDVTTIESFASQMRYDLLNRLVVLAQQGQDGNLDPTLNTCCVPSETANQTLFTLYGFDNRGNRTNLIDPKQNTTAWTYDGASRQLENQRHLRTNGDGIQSIFKTITTTSGYDSNSRLIWLIDDNGGTTTWNYDTFDRQTVTSFHDGSTRTNTFDLASDLTSYLDENGSAFANTFDVLGRKTAVSIAQATGVIGTTAQRFAYDGHSRMTLSIDSVSSVDADVAFAFDSMGRVVEEVQTCGGDIRYITHDAFTGLTSTDLTYPNSRQVTSGYDALYRRNTSNETSGGASIAAWQFFGRRSATVTLGNGITCSFMNNAQTNSAVQSGVSQPAWGDKTTDRIGYDGSGRMIAKRFLPSESTASLVGFTTQYDPSSNKLFERALHGDESHSSLYPTYDSVERLLRYQRGILALGGGSVATAITLPGTDNERIYDLDGLGNWKKTIYTPEGTTTPASETRQHNKMNEITQFATTAVVYDHGNHSSNGNPLIAQRGNGNIADDGTLIYAYDAMNRLINVKSTATGTPQIAAYTYDALGRRALKVVSTSVAGTIAAVTYRYLYDGQRIVEEGLVSGGSYTPLRQFVWGQYIDELVQINVPSDNATPPLTTGRYYPLQDLLYRTIATTNQSGANVEAYDYDAYGNTLMFNGKGSDGQWFTNDDVATLQPMCEFLFMGRQYDPETEIYWYRSRYYQPALARLMSRDLNSLGLLDAYQFVLSNPIRRVDPLGLQAIPATQGSSTLGDNWQLAADAVDRSDWPAAQKAMTAAKDEYNKTKKNWASGKTCCAQADDTHIVVTHLALVDWEKTLGNRTAITPDDAGYPHFPGNDPLLTLPAGDWQLMGVVTRVQLKSDAGCDTSGCSLSCTVTDRHYKNGQMIKDDTHGDFGGAGPFFSNHRLNTSYAGNWYIDTPITPLKAGAMDGRFFQMHCVVLDQNDNRIPGLDAYYGWRYQIDSKTGHVSWEIWPNSFLPTNDPSFHYPTEL